MPLIETKNVEVQQFTGLHLYHAGFSSCAQRVRITLAEKNLEWTSHVVDLAKKEHATEEYQSINPMGLVPTFVDNGQVIIESVDIIDYIEEKFGGMTLMPASDAGKAEVRRWTAKADHAQHGLKLLTHEFLFKGGRRMTPEQLDTFLSNHHNEELGAFMRKFSSEEGFSKVELDEAVQGHYDLFQELDRALDGSDWLVENTFSLADIAWTPNVHRLDILGYPIGLHPNLNAWYQRIQERPSYISALKQQEPSKLLEHFRNYTEKRQAEKTDVRQFGPLGVRIK
ncbi:MAG: glutathione S-transferase family protein [Chloroflexota bacterium]